MLMRDNLWRSAQIAATKETWGGRIAVSCDGFDSADVSLESD
jgi:hypothetical protein